MFLDIYIVENAMTIIVHDSIRLLREHMHMIICFGIEHLQNFACEFAVTFGTYISRYLIIEKSRFQEILYQLLRFFPNIMMSAH